MMTLLWDSWYVGLLLAGFFSGWWLARHALGSELKAAQTISDIANQSADQLLRAAQQQFRLSEKVEAMTAICVRLEERGDKNTKVVAQVLSEVENNVARLTQDFEDSGLTRTARSHREALQVGEEPITRTGRVTIGEDSE